MMTGYRNIKTGGLARRLFMLLCLSLMVAAPGSCDRVIYDYEGDCSVDYRVRFRYDYNMKWADAFPHEVESVTLYLIDESGKVVWRKTEEGPALAMDGYAMEVDVEPGRYSLLAWCGTKDNASYIVPRADVAVGLTCTLDCKTDPDGGRYVDGEVDRLYYGYVADQEFSDAEGTHVYTVPLVKDTNSVRIVLQHTSGDAVDKDLFTFKITSDNWMMDWDNSVAGREDATYYAWHVDRAEADYGAGTTYGAAVAELTVGRLVKGDGTRLSVQNAGTGETVLSIPLSDIAVMVKGYYNREMDDQEYLDRQDEYDFVFFLDNGNRWASSYIYVNSWKIVLQNTGL